MPRHVGFDCARHMRVLARSGFLEVVPGGKYARLEAWPPAAAFFEGTPIGVAYYLQRWFRYRLQDWITKRMRELESKEGVYSLEQWQRFHSDHAEEAGGGPSSLRIADPGAECRDYQGRALAADGGMISKPLDVLGLFKPEAEMVAWGVGQVLPDAEVEFRGHHRSMTE